MNEAELFVYRWLMHTSIWVKEDSRIEIDAARGMRVFDRSMAQEKMYNEQSIVCKNEYESMSEEDRKSAIELIRVTLQKISDTEERSFHDTDFWALWWCLVHFIEKALNVKIIIKPRVGMRTVDGKLVSSHCPNDDGGWDVHEGCMPGCLIKHPHGCDSCRSKEADRIKEEMEHLVELFKKANGKIT